MKLQLIHFKVVSSIFFIFIRLSGELSPFSSPAPPIQLGLRKGIDCIRSNIRPVSRLTLVVLNLQHPRFFPARQTRRK